MKNLFMFTTCALMCAGLVFTSSSCKKILNSGGTMTVKGRLLQDCSGTPVKLMPLEFSLKSHNTHVGGESGTIGKVTTDLEGNFTLTGKNYGPGGLTIKSEFYRFVYDYSIAGGDGSVVDLGTVYATVSFYSAAKIHIQSTKGPTDTLYIGPPFDVRKVYPVVSGTTLDMLYVNTSPGETVDYSQSELGIIYAYNRKAYDSIRNKSIPRIPVKSNLCRVIDTTVVTVN